MISFRTGASIASLALALGSAVPAFAQDVPADEATPPEATIIVTGSRSSNRTVANSPVPVDVISSDVISSSGSGELNRVLNKVVPSFNFPQPAVSDGSDAIRPATLRGLSPDQVLVLVNGKRRHTSALINVNGTVGRGAAAVDMNTIPSLAIGSIEVLRDGASSQYGSDAIAGVINVRLKTTSEGGRATVSYGKYVTTIDGVPNVTGLVTSGGQPLLDTTDNRYFQYTTDGNRKARDGETWAVASNVGLPLGPDGYLNITGEFRSRDATNRQMADLRPNYFRASSTAPFDARELTFDRLNFRIGDPKAEDYTLFLNSAFAVGDGWEGYVFASMNQRDSLSAANWRQQNNTTTNRDYSVLSATTTPSNANFVPLSPDGYLPFIATDSTDLAGTVGIRGDWGDWKVDFSSQFGQNQLDYQTQNSYNVSYGPASQRTFDSGGLKYAQGVANLDLAREFDMGFAKPVSFAVGAEFRSERYTVRAGDSQSYSRGPLNVAPFKTTATACAAQGGTFDSASLCTLPGRVAAFGAQGFPGIPAASGSDHSRRSVAGYVELDTDPVENLTTTLAGRFEHFSDFGNTLTGKFAARYEFVPGFAVRGAISNGFRAPSLHQQYFSAFSTNFVSGVPVDILTVPVSSPLAQLLGAKPLKPEKSINYSAGITANPLSGLTLTVDYYNIKITDRIVLTENLGAGGSNSTAVNTAVGAVLTANGYAGLGAARFFINGIDTRTQGVDAVLNYRLPLGDGMGKWTLTAAYNYTKNQIIARKAVLGPLASVPNLTLFGRTESLRFEKGQPRDKIVLSLDGDVGLFGLTARTTRYGKVVSPGTTAPIADPTSLTAYGPDDIFLAAKWITDLELRINPTERFHVTVGADNVFDVYPTRSPYGLRPTSVGGSYPANQQYFPFSVFSPFGFNGRFLYARAAIDF